jgi:Reprolysin (M12B) family zinc metalloprotease/ADAM cysteine-rich/Disintegrin
MPLNIFVVLKGVIVWRNRDEITISSDSAKTLKSFAAYRERLFKDHTHDNAYLLTDTVFDDNIVGKALINTMCAPSGSGGIAMDHSEVVAIVATTIAHELGHNFGMQHDTDDCFCRGSRRNTDCVMATTSTSIAPTHWSSCSIDQLNDALKNGIDFCLKDKPEKLFDSPTCGNGFLEPGEECDCGLPEYCDNLCCNPQTCMLAFNAFCATGSCCDLATCKPYTAGESKFQIKCINFKAVFFAKGKTCRKSINECDLPEQCNGKNELCPEDVFKRDTDECEDGKAHCYQGSCRSHENQCKILWGPMSDSFELCYEHNLDGDKNGNCGYNHATEKYVPCEISNMLCGRLQCRALNQLQYTDTTFRKGDNPMTAKKYKGHEVICHTAIFPGLSPVDPGMTPDGVKCGNGKICMGQKCVSVARLKKQGKILECPDCHGNGVCNSKGHCHCDEGWAPPFCNEPKTEDSGSIDVELETDEDSKLNSLYLRRSERTNVFLGKYLKEIIYVLLGVIVVFLLIGFFICLRKSQLKCWKKLPE